MKKSLIAVAVAGLFAAPVAMAEVTLSGAINLGIELAKSSSTSGVTTTIPGVGTTVARDGLTRTFLNANYSHVDLESVDDIGNGNKIVFHYQLVAQPQNVVGGDDVNRNSFLGVVGTWGAFKMGSNENVYERFMYSADPLDGAVGPGGNLMILGTPGLGTAFDVGQNAGGVGFYRRTDHTIWYESPNFSGFTFEIDQTLSAFKTGGPAGRDPKVLSIGGKFEPEGGPFYVDVAYEKHNDLSMIQFGGTNSKDTGMQVGGGLKFGDLGLHLRFERLKYEIDGTAGGNLEIERDAIWFGMKFNLPSGYIGAELGLADEWDVTGGGTSTSAADTDARMFGIGYFHNLSKQSQLQFIYGRTDNAANATYTQAGAPNGGAPGSDHQVFHAGIKHTF